MYFEKRFSAALTGLLLWTWLKFLRNEGRASSIQKLPMARPIDKDQIDSRP